MQKASQIVMAQARDPHRFILEDRGVQQDTRGGKVVAPIGYCTGQTCRDYIKNELSSSSWRPVDVYSPRRTAAPDHLPLRSSFP